MIFTSKKSQILTTQTELGFEQSSLVISPSVLTEQKQPVIYLGLAWKNF